MTEMAALPRPVRLAVIATVERAMATRRLDRYTAWPPHVRSAILQRLWDHGMCTQLAGDDRIVVEMEARD